jgi:hypothetical protein
MIVLQWLLNKVVTVQVSDTTMLHKVAAACIQKLKLLNDFQIREVSWRCWSFISSLEKYLPAEQ